MESRGQTVLLGLFIFSSISALFAKLQCNTATEYEMKELYKCCTKCQAGEYVVEKCTRGRDTVCKPCDKDYYNPSRNSKRSCDHCTVCVNDLINKEQCTLTSNTKCQCKPGLQCVDDECTRCEPTKVTTKFLPINVIPRAENITDKPSTKGQLTQHRIVYTSPSEPTDNPGKGHNKLEDRGYWVIAVALCTSALAVIIMCMYLLHRRRAQDTIKIFQDNASSSEEEEETKSEWRCSEEEEGPAPIQEETQKEGSSTLLNCGLREMDFNQTTINLF
ncbi:CD27 antigen isoform X1 [Polypterus senegalus]|uniref:CD27 antigen isoform X1 n=1 Tax=Polypterus senegalus TaxID=55291 RepID=UPI0019652917|nr:CD27 antigen isoform X1 [Polypterus senegalus]